MAIAIFLWGLVLSNILGCFALCDDDATAACQRSSGMADFLRENEIELSADDHYDPQIFALGKAEIKEFCRMFDSYKTCLDEDVIPMCGKEEEGSHLAGYNQGFHFLCGESLEDYTEKYQSCVQKAAVEFSANCGNFTVTNASEICREWKDTKQCQIHLVKSMCSHKAAKWFRTFIEKTIHPVLNFFGCETNDDSDYSRTESVRSHLIKFGIAMLGLTLMLGFCGIMIRRKLNASRKDDEEAVSDDEEEDENDQERPGVSEPEVAVSDKKKLVPV